ncbi:hypothetical protein GCM10028895_22270 [Pontibacter rugosus]
MGKADGFLTYGRELPAARDPKERINDSNEIYTSFPEEKQKYRRPAAWTAVFLSATAAAPWAT